MADVHGLPGNPLEWLLDGDEPAVRHLALRQLLGRPRGDADATAARDAAMRTAPIATILGAQDPAGWWVRPGSGYLPKYTSTVWQVIFLDQVGADGTDPRIRAACDYVLEHTRTTAGGFGAVARGESRPPPVDRGPLPEPLPVHREDDRRHRCSRAAEPVGHTARMPGAQGRGRGGRVAVDVASLGVVRGGVDGRRGAGDVG